MPCNKASIDGRLLTIISEELLDAPLYVNLHVMCHTVNATVPKLDYFTSAIVEAGYRSSFGIY